MKAKDLINFVEEENVKPATMEQSKKRWKEHTSKVLSKDAKDSFKKGTTWMMMGEYPVVVSADKNYILYFSVNEFGNTVGWQGVPPGITTKQANCILQGGVCEDKESIMVKATKKDGTVIANMTPDEFMKAMGSGGREALKTAVDRYNQSGGHEGVTAKIVLSKDEQNIKYHGYKECPSCKGKGHVPAGGGLDQCGYCKGSGLVLNKKPQIVNFGSQERPVTPLRGIRNFTKDPSFL